MTFSLRFMVILFAFSSGSAQSISALIEWDPSQSTNVVGYHIYRIDTSQTTYERLTPSPIGSSSYVDSTLEYGEGYWYVATAVDSSGLESLFSNEATLDLICRGDVNIDRQRNVLDVVQIQNHIVGNALLQGNSLTAGDVDNDSMVSVLDAVRLLNHVVGNITLSNCIM